MRILELFGLPISLFIFLLQFVAVGVAVLFIYLFFEVGFIAFSFCELPRVTLIALAGCIL